jgi:hypothetical protein
MGFVTGEGEVGFGHVIGPSPDAVGHMDTARVDML